MNHIEPNRGWFTPLAVLILVTGLAAPLPGAITIHVPGDVPTITQAVALASSGDTILVAGGSYTESVTVSSGTLTFVAGSPEETFWNAAPDLCLEVNTSGNVTMHGFVLQNAAGQALGCYGSSASLHVENCTLQNNGRWGIHNAADGSLTAINCLMRNNNTSMTTLTHGGVRFDSTGATALIEGCTIISDTNTGGVGIHPLNGSDVEIRGCTIRDAQRGIAAGNAGTRTVVTDTQFSGCTVAIYADRNAELNAGDLGNSDPTDDGGNIFFPDNTDFHENGGASVFLAEGNLYPRIDSAYLTARVLGSVDYSPALHVVVERAATHPDPVKFPTPVPDGQFLEIRAVANEPGVYPIDLGDWMLSDDPLFSAGDEGIFEIPGGTTINTGQSIMFAWNLAEIDRVWGIHPTAQTFDLSTASPEIALSIASDEVFLSPSTVGIHDALLYGATDDTVDPTVWLAGRVPLGPEGTLFTRDLDSTDTNTAADWTSEYFGGRLNTTPVSGWEVYR
ncbi:right-handed parallel beta-helix repeat-containing protein [Candidatus Sumerlaeota bacterium]|nr:right-handed parallel beta-helix repeat-containing protein [Candidatus Sumerlaeota bacterium]